MRKGFFGICLSLVVAIVLLAAFVPSCGPATATGTIVVQATLCGIPWPAQATGPLNYKLTLTGGTSINGTAVPTTHSGAAVGTWTCAYASGGPQGAFLNSIQPSVSQNLAANGTITFTFDFELNQDAAIEWLTWTISEQLVLPNGPGSPYQVVPCNFIDTHFLQWVKGCNGYNVTMNETSWLNITQIAGPPGPAVQIVVVDDWWAVNKTPAHRGKVSQNCTIGGMIVHKDMSIPLQIGTPVTLDVETVWKLVKGTNYTKAINWLGIGSPQEPPHNGVLFELVVPQPGQGPYIFQLQTAAEVALVDDVDVDPVNNLTGWSLPLFIRVP